MKARLYLTALGLAVLSAPASAALPAVTAQTELYKPAAVGSPFLGVPIGPRALGMGEAFTAMADDLYALHWNPAGLSQVSEFQLGLMHNEHFSDQGIRQEFLGYAHPMNNAGLGVSLNYFGLGAMELRDDVGALLGEESALAFATTVGYGRSFGQDQNLSLGMAVEFGMENVLGTSLTAFGGSIGVAYEAGENFRLGLAAQHLGAASAGFMPPGTVAAGASYFTSNRSFIFGVEGAIPLNDDPFLRSGAEINIKNLVQLRGGYRLRLGGDGAGDLLSGPTAGLGFKVKYMQIDYAFVPAGDLTTTHRVSATLALPNDFFKPKVVVQSTQNTTYAYAKYKKGRDMYKRGDRVAALIEFKQCVDAYPVDKIKKPQKFLAIAKKAIDRIQKELSKKGGNEKVVAAINKELAVGERYMAKGDNLKAIEKFSRALELDENHERAKELMSQAQDKLRAQKAGLLAKGRKAFAEGNLAGGVRAYNQVLEIDPNDASAKKALASKKSAIRIEIKKLHRKGIDHYVNGRIKDAVTIWKRALALDWSDPTNLKRDIEKGEKLLQAKERK